MTWKWLEDDKIKIFVCSIHSSTMNLCLKKEYTAVEVDNTLSLQTYVLCGVMLHYNHNQRYSSAQNWASERETCSSPPCAVYLRGKSFMCAHWAKCLLKPWHDPNRHEHTGGLKPRAVGQTLNTMTSSPIPESPSALQTMPGQENKPSISVHSCAFVSLSIRQRRTTQA